MKTIKIIELTLENFKGVRKLKMPFSSMVQTIRGENHTGKTTVFDAVCWTLFDKDSLGRGSNFGIMTLDEKGEIIHRIDHRVTLALSVDGRTITLSKNFREKWTKKRGSVEETYDGNEIIYSVDQIPCNKTEYQAKIRDIIPEDTFRMVTDVLHFSRLPWLEQKKILRSLAGDAKIPEEKLNSNPIFHELVRFLAEGHTVDEYAKRISSLKTPIKKRIDEIPSEIEGMQDSIPDVDAAAINKIIADLNAEKNTKQAERNEISAQIENTASRIKAHDLDKENIRARIEKVNKEIARITSQASLDLTRRFDEDNFRYRQYNQAKSDLDEKLKKLESEHTLLAEQITKTTNLKENLYEQYDNLEKARWRDGDTNCPECGQPLPADIIEREVKEFEEKRKLEIAKVIKYGRQTAESIETFKQRLADNEKESAEIKSQIAALQPVNKPTPTDTPDLSGNKEYLAATQRKIELNKELEAMVYTDSTTALSNQRIILDKEIKDIDDKILEQQRILGETDTKRKILDNIEKRKNELRENAQELTKLEREEQAIIDYKRLEVETIEATVNSKFSLVSFRFYKPLVNGGFDETCECTMHGTPYASLSASEKVNAGLDIINALQLHYDVLAPIFIDNAEGVNEFLHTEAQIVRLYVSSDKQLTFSNDLI